MITDKAQIKIAELIESDLKLPADATFARSSVAYLFDGTQVVANQPRFEQGKFGKAIMLEEGTENLLNNPTFEGESGLASCFAAYGSGVNYEIVNDGYLLNTLSQRIYYNSPAGDGSDEMNKGIMFNITGQIGDVFTITFYGKGWEENDIISIYRNAATHLSLKKEQLEGGWTKYTYIIQLTDTATICYIRPNNNREYSFDCLINAPQIEAKPYPTSFTDSTRAAETLTIPTEGVLNPQEGTIEFTVIPNHDSSVSPARVGFTDLGFLNRNSCSGFLIRRRQNVIDLIIGTGTTYEHYSYTINWNAKEQLALAVKWDLDNTFVLLKGQRVITAPKFNTVNLPSSLMIGNRHDDVIQAGNAFYDDFRISNRARSDEEILAAYQSGKPLLVDEWTTYKLDFDDKVRITTQGQIICNELIEI